MPRKKNQIIVRVIFFILCTAIIITTPIMVVADASNGKQNEKMTAITVWQVDSFEGGKGSRTNYLNNVGKSFSNEYDCYINVISINSDAVRTNFSNNNFPDLLSYGAGIFGIENYLHGKVPYYTWAYGSYCFLTLDEKADFTDISANNTIINKGIDNFSNVAAVFCGVHGATVDTPTGAYTKLISGKYKYLLGTQRDIFRLKTRGVSFKIKPVSEFNDLFQNISIITTESNKTQMAQYFVNFLLSHGDSLNTLGLMGNTKLYDDELGALEGINYRFRLIAPISEPMKDELNKAAENSDINLLKNLLK